MITIRPDQNDYKDDKDDKVHGVIAHDATAIADDATDDAASDTDEHKKRIPLVWIPATLGIGLLIAAIYLGGRIVRAHPATKPAAVQSATPASTTPAIPPPPAPPEITKPTPPSGPPVTTEAAPQAPTEKPPHSEPLTLVTPDDGVPMITPKSGDLYIQVGALDQEATRRFVQHLRRENMDPHVATGPTPQLMRVLIGPFDNRAALNEKKAQLESEGVDTFVRQY